MSDCLSNARIHLSAAYGGTHTVAAKRFPAPDGSANRAASSKPARFFRRWRHFAGFPLKGKLWTVQSKKAPLEGSWPRSGLRGEIFLKAYAESFVKQIVAVPYLDMPNYPITHAVQALEQLNHRSQQKAGTRKFLRQSTLCPKCLMRVFSLYCTKMKL